MLTSKSGSRSSYSRRLTLAQQQLARFTDSRSSRSRRRVPRQQLATFTDSQSRRRRRVPRQQLDRFNSGRSRPKRETPEEGLYMELGEDCLGHRMDWRETLPHTERTLVRKRPGWFRRKCPAVFGAFHSEAWKSLAPVVYLGAVLSAVVIYSMINKLYGFLAQIFIPQYRYPYLVPLAFTQVVLTLLALSTLHALRCVTLAPYSLRLGERLLVPYFLAVCDVGWTHILGRLRAGVVGFIFSHDSHLPSSGDLYFLVRLLLHSLSLSWLAKVGEAEKGGARERVPVLDIYFSLTVNKSLVLGFLCLLHPDGPRMLRDGSWHSLLFLGYLLGLMLLGSLQRLLLGVAAMHYSPVAAALLTSAHDLAKPFSSLL
ncbi:hypothetical protein AAFF_G00085360 [Aldrovandia affinis]|uniref:Transmembrane protein n=1 Tax=Aldrovandia affinis TaxID=143900 RepID=A0AAD7RWP3_9TELE|nr:hypothetical protein AAFF_G00085360 [Aldrovandia affinis]